MRSPFPSRTPRALLLLAFLALPIAACDSSGEDKAAADGTFRAQVSGAAHARLRGQAAFASRLEGDRLLSAIGLFDAADDEDAVFLFLDGSAAVRTYQADGAAAGAVLLLGADREGTVYVTKSGTITIDRADAALITGSFDVMAWDLVHQDQPVRLRGSFSAKPGAVTPPWNDQSGRGQ